MQSSSSATPHETSAPGCITSVNETLSLQMNENASSTSPSNGELNANISSAAALSSFCYNGNNARTPSFAIHEILGLASASAAAAAAMPVSFAMVNGFNHFTDNNLTNALPASPINRLTNLNSGFDNSAAAATAYFIPGTTQSHYQNFLDTASFSPMMQNGAAASSSHLFPLDVNSASSFISNAAQMTNPFDYSNMSNADGK